MKFIKFENVENLENIVENFEELENSIEIITNDDGSVMVEVDDFEAVAELNCDTLNECDVYVYRDIDDVIDDLKENCYTSTLVNCVGSLPYGYEYYSYFVLDDVNEVIECYNDVGEILITYVEGVSIVEVDNEN